MSENPVPPSVGDSAAPRPRVSLWSIALIFFGIGAVSFGGGMTGWVYRECVLKRGWMSEAEFLNGLAVAQTLPGGNVANLTAYVGNYLRGIPGAVIGIVALLFVPSVSVVILFAFYREIAGYPGVSVGLEGVAAGAIGLLLFMAWKTVQEVKASLVGIAVMVATFLAVGVMKWNLLVVFLCLAPLSVALAWPRGNAMRSDDLWTIFLVFAPLSLIAFGGNLTVLSSIQRQAVEVHGWLTPREFVEYFAISRASPGPGAMVVTLIGWKVAGFLGALIATLALYVPSFTLALLVSRVWERYRGRSWHTALQKGLTPVAAGLLLAANYSLLVLTGSLVMAAIAFASFACFVIRPRISPLWLLAGGGVIAVAAARLASG